MNQFEPLCSKTKYIKKYIIKYKNLLDMGQSHIIVICGVMVYSHKCKGYKD